MMGNRAFANMIVRLRLIKLIKKNDNTIYSQNEKKNWHPPVFFRPRRVQSTP